MIERILDAIELPCHIAGHDFLITCSMGVAGCRLPGSSRFVQSLGQTVRQPRPHRRNPSVAGTLQHSPLPAGGGSDGERPDPRRGRFSRHPAIIAATGHRYRHRRFWHWLPQPKPAQAHALKLSAFSDLLSGEHSYKLQGPGYKRYLAPCTCHLVTVPAGSPFS